MANDKAVDNKFQTVSAGDQFVHKETGEEVVVFVTEINGTVGFSRVGSSREERMRVQDFRAAYDPKPRESDAGGPEPALKEPGSAEPTIDSKPIRTNEQKQMLDMQRSGSLFAEPADKAKSEKKENK